MTDKETPVNPLGRAAANRARRWPAVLLGVLVALTVLAVPTSASAAVVWDSEVFQAPSNLPPDTGAADDGRGMIWIHVKNAGGDSAGGWPTVEFELPVGVTLGTPAPPGSVWTCTGTTAVTCDGGFLGGLFPVGPFRNTTLGNGVEALRLTVDIAPGAPEGAFPFDVTVSGAGGAAVTKTHTLSVGSEPLGFGPVPGSFEAGAFDQAGDDYTQAGGRPHDVKVNFGITTRFAELDPGESASWFRSIQAAEPVKDIVVDAPPGFIGDPTATPKCADLGRVEDRTCPAASQVGVVGISPPGGSSGKNRMYGVYNVEPADNHPAEFAFRAPVGTVLMVPTLRSDGDMGITVKVRNTTEADTIYKSHVTLWGVPADPTHDAQRCQQPNFVSQSCTGSDEVGELYPNGFGEPASSSAPVKPFLANPTRCTGTPEITRLHLSSWANVGRYEVDGDPDLTDPAWKSDTATAPPLTGCDQLQFNPSISSQPTTAAPDSPTGLDFRLSIPQNDAPDGLATAHLDDTTVLLPEGMVVNPSSADGLAACSPAAIGLVSKNPLRFTKLEPTCPDGSKIGTVEVRTPLLEDPLSGEVYVATQGDNPFDSLLALYLVVRGPGILVKLAGHVEPDPRTGRLKTTVIDNPQLPFDTLELRIKAGSRAPLKTPADCGGHRTTAALTSWAGQSANLVNGFAIACPGSAGSHDPGFSAGASNPVAGDYSPFAARITRPGGKELGRIDMTLPRGMLARLKDVDVCTGAQLAAAASRPGRTAQQGPGCPAGSQVGTITTGTGAGPTPFYPRMPGTNVSGRAFLTEAHTGTRYAVPGVRQAAYGLAFEVPAVAGPFDLGTVVVRAAIFVDPVTAQLTVRSDPMPRILQGIPLDVRDVRVNIDREEFSTTPTSCRQTTVEAGIVAQDGTSAARTTRYQVGDCGQLRFKPRLALRLTGRRQVRIGRHPGVRAVVRQSGLGEAGIRRARVVLPSSLALDPDNAQALCEFEDGTKPDLENHCPAGSKVGRARARTPLLKRDLVGDVYFVKNIRRDPRTGNPIRTLPMIVVALRGEAAINLKGESSTTRAGRLVNTFAAVPDAPITRFNLNIKGGRNGILAVTETRRGERNLCKRPHGQVSNTVWRGQNGDRSAFRVRAKTPCPPRRAQKKRRATRSDKVGGVERRAARRS